MVEADSRSSIEIDQDLTLQGTIGSGLCSSFLRDPARTPQQLMVSSPLSSTTIATASTLTSTSSLTTSNLPTSSRHQQFTTPHPTNTTLVSHNVGVAPPQSLTHTSILRPPLLHQPPRPQPSLPTPTLGAPTSNKQLPPAHMSTSEQLWSSEHARRHLEGVVISLNDQVIFRDAQLEAALREIHFLRSSFSPFPFPINDNNNEDMTCPKEKTKTDGLQKELDEMKTRLENILAERTTHRNEVLTFQSEVETLRLDLRKKEDQLRVKEEQIELDSKTVDSLSGEVRTMKEALGKVMLGSTNRIRDLEAEVNKAEKERDEMRLEKETIEMRLREIKVKEQTREETMRVLVGVMDTERRGWFKEKNNLLMRIEGVEKTLEQKDEELVKLKASLIEVEKQLRWEKVRASDLSDELAAARSENAELHIQVEELRNANHILVAERDHLRESYDHLEKESQSMAEDLIDLRVECSNLEIALRETRRSHEEQAATDQTKILELSDQLSEAHNRWARTKTFNSCLAAVHRHYKKRDAKLRRRWDEDKAKVKELEGLKCRLLAALELWHRHARTSTSCEQKQSRPRPSVVLREAYNSIKRAEKYTDLEGTGEGTELLVRARKMMKEGKVGWTADWGEYWVKLVEYGIEEMGHRC
nr:uncharacterized protein CI109_004677 [Kwoniella shandongensis]KAA5526901.1 hypothetical protein CI109_004677 [Kwoniella shandongensis]